MTGSPANDDVKTVGIQETSQEQVTAKVLGVESSKLQKLGLQCISPGLSSDNIDNKMLSTIRMSKTIAREQRQHIEKLGGAAEATTAAEQAPRAGGSDNSPNSESSSAAGQSLSQTTLAKPRGKSLRRNKVPMPLNIASAGGARQGQREGLYPLGVESAPANMTNYKQAQLMPPHNRILKPRVQYVGRTQSRQAPLARRGLPSSNSAIMSIYPYGMNYPPQLSHLQYPMLPHMMAVPPPTAYSRLNMPAQTPYAPLNTSASKARACSTNTKIQVDFENFMDRNKQTQVGTRDVFANNTSRWAPLRSQPLSAQEDFFFKRNVHRPTVDQSDNENSSERTDDSGVDNTALENVDEDEEHPATDTLPCQSFYAAAIGNSEISAATGVDKIRGEVTIMDDTFAFEFPTIKDKMDKKMFMSICDKVWDESKKLNCNPQREME